MKNKIIFGKPSISEYEIELIKKTYQSKWIGMGKKVKQFEYQFSKYKKSKYSISTSSCTDALTIVLKSLNLKKNDEVITSPMTFCATINSIINAGGKPILCDINPRTLNIDPDQLLKKINKKTKAIVVVHFAGLSCDLKKIKALCGNKIKIIEDCAHAIETKYDDIHSGNFSYAGCFSFYVNKNITTGEGGMITTNSKKLNHFAEIFRQNGMSKNAWKRYISKDSNHISYDVFYPGTKSNMTDVQATLGIQQLHSIRNFYSIREKLFKNYQKKLDKLPLIFQKFNSNKFNRHAYHLFVCVLDTKKTKKKILDLFKFLNKKRIGYGIHYRAINSMTYYKKKFRWNRKTAPIAFDYGNRIFSLPLYPSLTMNEQEYIIKNIKLFFEN